MLFSFESVGGTELNLAHFTRYYVISDLQRTSILGTEDYALYFQGCRCTNRKELSLSLSQTHTHTQTRKHTNSLSLFLSLTSFVEDRMNII